MPAAEHPLSKHQIRDHLFGAIFSRLFVFTILFEDTDIEERFFGVDERSRVLAVAAAGCGIASLLARRPERIDAVDTNPHHLCLTALKVSAARNLASYRDFYDLFGRGTHPRARELVLELSKPLPAWMQRYWRRRHRVFRRGLYRHGLLSNSLKLVRSSLPVDDGWFHWLATLPPEKRQEEAVRVCRELLGRPIFATAARSPLLLLAQGINFRQRDRNLRGSNASNMVEVAIEFFRRAAATDLEKNWILWHVALGHFNHDDPEAVPPYLRRTHHSHSVGAPTRTEFHQKSFLKLLREAPEANWTHYNFSDALDWMPESLQREVLNEVVRTSRPGAIFLNRSVEGECLAQKLGLGDRFEWLESESLEATSMERSKLYQRVDLYRVRG